MLKINEKVAVNVVWKDDDEFKELLGVKWFNGETKIFNPEDGHKWICFGRDYMTAAINATSSIETEDGITIRAQVNAGLLHIGDMKDANYKMPEYDEKVGKDMHDRYFGFDFRGEGKDYIKGTPNAAATYT